MKMKRPADYGVNDPIFDGMWLQRLAVPHYGAWIVRCECAKRQAVKQARNQPGISWKRIEGTAAKVSSLTAARDWAEWHLGSQYHKPA